MGLGKGYPAQLFQAMYQSHIFHERLLWKSFGSKIGFSIHKESLIAIGEGEKN